VSTDPVDAIVIPDIISVGGAVLTGGGVILSSFIPGRVQLASERRSADIRRIRIGNSDKK
jgi:hypothetical protein